MKYLIQIHESFIKEMMINTDDVCFLLLYSVMRCNGISRYLVTQKYWVKNYKYWDSWDFSSLLLELELEQHHQRYENNEDHEDHEDLLPSDGEEAGDHLFGKNC